MIRHVFVLAALALATLSPPASAARIRVIASINDLASIAASVGGGDIEVSSLARPNSDAHRVEVLPSYMVRVSRAQVYLKVGLGLDQWADAIIDGSRNARIRIVDCSQGIAVLEKPTGKVDASMGDVHPNGNPHYWLDPRNGAVVARTIAEALATADPVHAASYRSRAEAFAKDAQASWVKHAAATKAMPVHVLLTYHRSWSYFVNAFGFEVAGTVEPVPGIPPTARHLADLIAVVRARGVRVLLEEPYFSDDAGRFLARQTGLTPVVISPACDQPVAGSYLAHFDSLVKAVGESERKGGTP